MPTLVRRTLLWLAACTTMVALTACQSAAPTPNAIAESEHLPRYQPGDFPAWENYRQDLDN